MSWLSSFLDGPSVGTVSTVDPYLKSNVVDPLVGQIGQSVFGSPAQYSQANGLQELLYALSGGRVGSTGSTQTSAAVPGAFSGGTPDWVYQGQRTPGYQPLQQQYFDTAGKTAAQQVQGLQGIINGNANLDALYNYGQRYANDVITPNVMERFAGLGTASSGGAAKGLSRELSNYGLGLQAQMAPLALQNQAQQLQALGQLGDVSSQLGTAGAMQYDVQQQRLGAQQQRFNESQPWNHPGLQYLATLLGGTQQQPVQNSGGIGYSMLSGLAGSAGSSLGSGLMGLLGL